MSAASLQAGHALARASLDACVKCNICETQCPVMAVQPNFAGPKFVGPQAERFRQGESVDRTLDYCSSCGSCTLACPQGVKVAELNSQARAVMKAGHMPLRDRLISQTVLMGKVMSPIAPLANGALRVKALRVLIEAFFGVARDAPMPVAAGGSFERWFARRAKRRGGSPPPDADRSRLGPDERPDKPRDGCDAGEVGAAGEADCIGRLTPNARSRGKIVFFHGCAGNYFEVETSKRAVEVLEHLGYEVLVPRQGCCGLARQSNGIFDGATKNVLELCAALRSAGADLPIVSASGSCTGMLKHEAHEIMGVDTPELADVSARVKDVMEFLADLDAAGELPHKFQPIEATVPYHAPCQLKSQGMGLPALDVLALIPGLKVVESGRACCGIAGTYGLKKEKRAIAQAVGAPLFEMFRETGGDLGICDTETCRWQLRQGSGMRVEHPIFLVHQALGLGDA
ncbi:MAG: anaerobic glycerol-3-phosphate dehydrogenase subunit C [Bifidobacteriaceae bacterium]|jgi:glycerol-3-phosphate dehydrogenase subunit C|nr:anaerobic glycerol-3-phosphate dehydrogenase subunit C [Bifidobacteriaceae bacterium]